MVGQIDSASGILFNDFLHFGNNGKPEKTLMLKNNADGSQRLFTELSLKSRFVVFLSHIPLLNCMSFIKNHLNNIDIEKKQACEHFFCLLRKDYNNEAVDKVKSRRGENNQRAQYVTCSELKNITFNVYNETPECKQANVVHKGIIQLIKNSLIKCYDDDVANRVEIQMRDEKIPTICERLSALEKLHKVEIPESAYFRFLDYVFITLLNGKIPLSNWHERLVSPKQWADKGFDEVEINKPFEVYSLEACEINGVKQGNDEKSFELLVDMQCLKDEISKLTDENKEIYFFELLSTVCSRAYVECVNIMMNAEVSEVNEVNELDETVLIDHDIDSEFDDEVDDNIPPQQSDTQKKAEVGSIERSKIMTLDTKELCGADGLTPECA